MIICILVINTLEVLAAKHLQYGVRGYAGTDQDVGDFHVVIQGDLA